MRLNEKVPDSPELSSDLRTFLSHKVLWDGAVLPFNRYGRQLELSIQIEPGGERTAAAADVSISDSFANISLNTSRNLVTSTPCKRGSAKGEEAFYMMGETTRLEVGAASDNSSVAEVVPLRPLGGLQAQLKIVTDAVQTMLEESDSRRRQPVNGILLFGPPGTGKSLLAETVSRRFPSAYRQVVAGPELYSKYLGETEAQLRQVFTAAVRSAPAILILEDLDCLSPRRESSGGSDLERRLTVTLQTILDRIGQEQSRNKERLLLTG